MVVIPNKWVEKLKQKKAMETAPSYVFDTQDTWKPSGVEKIAKRHTNAARAMYKQTLRGVRK